jgi:eukaryotic-like serine/threonine-protein kinase
MEERCGIWRLEHILAVGGIGEVWHAVGPDGAQVALKRLHSHLLRHDAVRAMFETECRALFELPPHPALVHGVDRGDWQGRPWVAMRRADGEDLRRYLDGGAPRPGASAAAPRRTLPAATALRLLVHACDAVSHLHEHGWVHGDVVPANLMIGHNLSSVVLCDLGVLRRCGRPGPVQGTHAYMAPEQVRGEPWTAATDVFALGVILWELLQGRRLFHRGPSWLTMQAVLEHEAAPLADHALDAVVRDALARNPGDRLADARSLAFRLEACGAAITNPRAHLF